MFTGKYGFFTYKYDIPGYSGQDYGGTAQWVYLIASFVLLASSLWLLRNTPRARVKKIVAGVGVFLVLFYIAKTAWETVHDIEHFGSFNTSILPFDTCSLIMPAALIAGFGRGKLARCAACWLATGGVLGGFGTMLFLTAFHYYPFLSFGALYSMLWHVLMVFTGLLLVVTDAIEPAPSVPLRGFAFHVLFSLVALPINYILETDFMFYRKLSAVPFFSGFGEKFMANGQGWLNPFLMLGLYLICFMIICFLEYAFERLFRFFKLHRTAKITA